MPSSRRSPWILALIMGLAALPVAAQTGDPTNDSSSGDPVILGGTITLTGASNYSAATTIVRMIQPDANLIIYPGTLTYSLGAGSITPTSMSTSSTAGSLVLVADNTTTTGTSGSSIGTINLADLTLASSLYLSPAVPATSLISSAGSQTGGSTSSTTTSSGTITISGNTSVGLPVFSGTTLAGSSLSLIRTGGSVLNLSSGTNIVTSTTNALVISSGSLSLPQITSTPVTVSSGTVSVQSAATISSNLDLQSNGMLQIYVNGTGSGATNGQLTVSGDVTLSGDLAIIATTNLPAGSPFTILNKTSSGAVTGTFASRPQGSVVSVSGNDFVISYTGGDGNDVTLTALSRAQAWRHRHFGTTTNTGTAADEADFDGDGIPNLIEKACNLDPTKGNALPVTTAVKGSNLEYTYTRSVAAVSAGDIFTVEWNDTLGAAGWSSAGVTEEVQSDDGTTQIVKALVPAGSSGHRFMRLKVTPAP